MAKERNVPIGAEIRGNKAHFRVWAPLLKKINVVVETGRAPGEYPLEASREGYFNGFAAGVAAGDRYRFRLDGESLFPDPASRFQPEGPHGPSQVVDPTAFKWTDSQWKGVSLPGQVIYEMHIGTFTREGSWSAATRELSNLADLGITVIEVMPVSEFPGRFGWGYDGVFLFAPTRLYGTADEFRQFIDRAHSLGLGVILDVVYNHLGPDGNVLHQFCPHYFSHSHHTDWGKALNFDGPYSEGVREFFQANARYWIEDFHLDGLRLDATQQIFDTGESHILAEIGQRVRSAAGKRSVYVVAEKTAEQLTGYRVHRGALASLHRKPLPEVPALAAAARRVIVLEDLVDHANVGAIFRCAAALGVEAVFLSPRCADPLYRRSVKVSMGAVFAIPYARMTGWHDGLHGLRAAGFRLLALTPDPAAAPISAAVAGQGTAQRTAQKIALLLGTEGDGLSSRWLREADQAVRIPMHPDALASGVDSLNVVAAAAIACHLLAGVDQGRSG